MQKEMNDNKSQIPILDFDPTRSAVIEPTEVIKAIDVPKHCVLCFFRDVIRFVVEQNNLPEITVTKSESGENKLYKMSTDDRDIAIYHVDVGAPLAASQLEELIAKGCRKFMVVGSAGVLDRSIAMGRVIIPERALRDEGTSYHYLPPSKWVEQNTDSIKVIKEFLDSENIPYTVGKTWTTDGVYRETRKKVELRKSQGCISVEMEAAALFAVAQFRNVVLGQILYGGDDLSSDTWDSRDWIKQPDIRTKLFYLALKIVSKL